MKIEVFTAVGNYEPWQMSKWEKSTLSLEQAIIQLGGKTTLMLQWKDESETLSCVIILSYNDRAINGRALGAYMVEEIKSKMKFL